MTDYPRHNIVMEREGLDKVCGWKLGQDQNDKCPHVREKRDHTTKIKDSIVDCVGNTPMVRVNNITATEGIECEVLAKCEFMNPAGSVKDRIGRRMIVDAEHQGRIKKGDILIEPTSGNTGMGLAFTAAAKGYRMIITLPEKMSQEKQDALRGLGATVIRTPTEYAFDHLYSHLGIAYTLEKELGASAHVLDQYKNPGNPMVHYEETGQEIYDQCDGKIDYLVIGAGTGGTITGIARKLKELNPNIKIVGVDPNGSILAQPESLNEANPAAEGGQQTEGIGYDFLPRVFDRTVVDDWMKGPDKESFIMARRLMREEGLMCGGSSGTAMHGAIEYIKANKIGKGKRVVVLLPDNIRNYMTKHLNSDWMYERGYITEQECAQGYNSDLVPNKDWGQDLTVKDLPLHEATFMKNTLTCGEAIEMIQSTGFDQFPVKNEQGRTVGVLTDKNLMYRIAKNQVKLSDSIQKCVVRDIRQVSLGVTLNELSRVLVRNSFVLVEDKYFVTISDILALHTPKKEKATQQSLSIKAETAPVKAEASSLKWIAAGAMASVAGAAAFVLLKNK